MFTNLVAGVCYWHFEENIYINGNKQADINYQIIKNSRIKIIASKSKSRPIKSIKIYQNLSKSIKIYQNLSKLSIHQVFFCQPGLNHDTTIDIESLA